MSKFNIWEVVSPEDITHLNGEMMVNVPGLIKMAAAGAYFHDNDAGQKKCANLLDAYLSAGRKKGYGKGDMLRTAFSLRYPPNATAVSLANELGVMFSVNEVSEIMNRTGWKEV